MIYAEYYNTAYYTGLSLIVLLFVLTLMGYTYRRPVRGVVLWGFETVLLIYVILFIGLRDPDDGGDTSVYTRAFELVSYRDIAEEYDIGFLYFMKLFSWMHVQFFYLACACIYVILPHLTFKKWFKKNALIATVVMIVTMSFWGFGHNVMRNGLAAAFFIYGLGHYPRKLRMIPWMLLAALFHNSMYLPVLCLMASYFIKRTRLLIWIWVFTAGVTWLWREVFMDTIRGVFIIAGLTDQRTEGYLSPGFELLDFMSQYRYDFVLYSAVPILAARHYIYKKGFRDSLYTLVVNTYLLANTFWLLIMNVPFTDRIAYLSWFLMPVIYAYPLLKQQLYSRQYSVIRYVILCSMGFTLLIHFK